MSDDDRFKLTRRRALGSIATIGAASAAAGAGTMALFSDTETDSGNLVQAGTLNLKPGGSDTLNHYVTNLAPGESTADNVQLKNDGDLVADHLEINVTATQNDNATTPSEYPTNVGVFELALNLELTTLTYGGSSFQQSQLPGAFINDASTANGDPVDGVHITSNGQSVTDYNYATVDVSSAGKTVSDVSSSTVEYAWEEGTNNNANVPDEVFLILDDGTKLYRNRSGSGFGVAEIDQEVQESDWTNLTTDPYTSGVDPVDDFGSHVVETVAIGIGDFKDVNAGNPGNAEVFDVYVGDLNYAGTTKQWPTQSNPNLQDLIEDGVISIDDAQAPGAGTDFEIEFTLDAEAGNRFQGDGIDITYEFGLAQESDQNVL